MQVKIGSLVKFYTILLLSEEPKHGYDLMKELEETLGRKISTSQVYPFLKLLEKNRLIKIEEIGEREKKIYQLTKNGKKFVNVFLQRFGDLIDIAVEPKLTTCAHCSCKVYEGGHAEQMKGNLLKFCCMHCASAYKNMLKKRLR
ncbi:MAG TPA: PadR family transcriptional regulator [Candidatus Nanoarchaeia archaeon]|nr:PadR family transcriptional regulator [Candidatus Nanoarchaeia archaeon]